MVQSFDSDNGPAFGQSHFAVQKFTGLWLILLIGSNIGGQKRGTIKRNAMYNDTYGFKVYLVP